MVSSKRSLDQDSFSKSFAAALLGRQLADSTEDSLWSRKEALMFRELGYDEFGESSLAAS